MRRVALVLTVVLAACQSAAVASPSSDAVASGTPHEDATSSGTATAVATVTLRAAPTARPAATDAATAPSTTEVPTAPAIPQGSFATVVTDDLRLRSEPGVGPNSAKLEPLLDHGVVAIVLDGPVPADGFDWYLVDPHPTTDTTDEAEVPTGWVAAAGQDGEPWLARFDVCEGSGEPELWPRENSYSPAREDLACVGAREVQFSGYLGVSDTPPCFELEVPWSVEPAWLDPCQPSWFLAQQPDWSAPTIRPVLAPDANLGFDPTYERGLRDDVWEEVPDPSRWPPVGGTGQYDHPAARECRAVPTGSADASELPDPAIVVYECRTRFVVTSMGLRGP